MNIKYVPHLNMFFTILLHPFMRYHEHLCSKQASHPVSVALF